MNGVSPDIGWQIICFVVGVGGATAALLQALNARRTQKREVSFETVFATREDLGAVANDLAELERKFDVRFEDLRREMREDKTEILKAGEERAVKIHDRVNLVLSAVSKLEGRFDK